jgi:hypothetical protein
MFWVLYLVIGFAVYSSLVWDPPTPEQTKSRAAESALKAAELPHAQSR